MVLFRKRKSIPDFAGELILLHAKRFGYDALVSYVKQLRIAVTDQQLSNALAEWMLFGTYVVRQGVKAKCRENAAMSDAIINSFIGQFCTGLEHAGAPSSELSRLQHCIVARFQEYDRVQLESHGNPIYALGIRVSGLMFGHESPEAYAFAIAAGPQFMDSIAAITRVFGEFKVVN